MRIFFSIFLIVAFLTGCATPEPVEALSTGKGLRKVPTADAATIEKLTNAGAEILVKQPDYIIIRIDGMQAVQAVNTVQLNEADLIQRVVEIQLQDSTSVQTIVDMGIDLWDVEENKAVAQAYDLHITRLRDAGFTVAILEENSQTRREENK
ncbi:MAG: hypothetical protein ACRBF0_20235 [Calditrichia bacterium]